MKRIIITLLILLLVSIASLLIYPSPISSMAWQPPPAQTLGENPATRPNQALEETTLIAKGKIYGPEDVAVDSEGRIYASTQDGFIKRIFPDGGVETWVDLGGRPRLLTREYLPLSFNLQDENI